MKKWKFDDESLKKIYKEQKPNMSYGEFRKLAEQYVNTLINKVQKEIDNEKIA